MRSFTGMQFPLILLVTSLTFFSNISNTSCIFTPKQSIKDGETLVSKGNLFELGFFSPGKSKNRYLGIWYKNIESETVVWVANRDNPITDSSGVLKMDEEGKLVLLNQESRVTWSTNKSKAANPIAQLLDSGNLVIQEENNNDPEKYIWQSFDYPTDTLLPGMKLGLDLKTGVNRFLTSWKNADDPSTGDYSFNLDPHGYPEFFLYKGLIRVHRCGPWDGVIFSGVPTMPPFNGFNYSFIVNQEEIYYTFSLDIESVVLKLFMNGIGQLQYRLMGTAGYWKSVWYTPKDQCDNYRKCGAYSICHPMNNNFVCDCVKGFEPRYQKNWNSGERSGGCVPKMKFKCNKDDEFLVLKGIKMPDTSSSVFNNSISLKECEAECRNNCSCTAYANSDIRGGGIGCIVWFGDLIDLRNVEGGQDLYVRVAASKFANPPPSEINYSPPPTVTPHITGRKKKVPRVIIIPSIIFGIIILASSIFILSRWTKKRKGTKRKIEDLFDLSGTTENCKDTTEAEIQIEGSKQGKAPHLPVFDFEVIANATYNFSNANKLGMGGFGPVYKGTLPGGQVIAVKRLSKSSGQGLKEFKNEVILISKLQHRNLVRLLGCCIEGEEKMLLYEYMPNKSLDSFLFDPTKQGQLNWPRRFHIVEGIARGLLYLHRDSRLKIIHRDLKAGNILLDDEMNPKISDFGMARIFGGNQTLANTNRVVGTYGYMSPEYAMEGRFSEKSDVFSFGVLLLEIVSGKRINQFYLHEQSLSLVGFAWRLWNEGKEIELMDPTLRDSYSASEVLRCIRIGLLCVQEHAMERPTVSTVVLMLGMDTTHLPTPRQPGFTIESDLSLAGPEMCSVNNVSITEESGR